MKQCLACGGGRLERTTKKATFEYKGQVLIYDQPGVWCRECGEAFLEKSDKDATDLFLYDFKHALMVASPRISEYQIGLHPLTQIAQHHQGPAIKYARRGARLPPGTLSAAVCCH